MRDWASFSCMYLSLATWRKLVNISYDMIASSNPTEHAERSLALTFRYRPHETSRHDLSITTYSQAVIPSVVHP